MLDEPVLDVTGFTIVVNILDDTANRAVIAISDIDSLNSDIFGRLEFARLDAASRTGF